MIEAPQSGARSIPYKGLTNYTENDADYFFGRAEEADVIGANLKARRLTLLYGESGVGKSSVLRAGAVASLLGDARDDAADEDLRGPDGRPVVEYLPVVFSAWRDDPIAGLREAVRAVVADLVDPSWTPPAGHSLDATIRSAADAAHGYLLIVLDQFEEYFLYHPDESGGDTFAAQFVAAVGSQTLPASFLVSIREDALAKLDRFKRQIPKLYDSAIRVTHLDSAAAREAIERPVERFNEAHPDRPSVTFEDGLVETVIKQIRAGRVQLEQSGRGRVNGGGRRRRLDEIETPYLQLVMTRLWEEDVGAGDHELRLATLTRLGGATEIVKTHLDNKLDQLDPEERDTALDVFHHLVTPSGSKIAHTAADLADYSNHDEREVTALLEKLGRRESLIVRGVPPPPGDDGPPRYEIFHDVLASAILDWRTRQEQIRLEAERDAATKREEQERRDKLAAEERERREREAKEAAKQREARTRRILYGTLGGVVALVVVAAVVFALIQSDRAAESHRRDQSRQIAATALEVPDLDRASLLALEAHKVADTFDARSAILRIAANHQLGAPLRGHASVVYDVAVSPNGKLLASVGYDKTLRVWDVATRKSFAFPRQRRPLNAVAWRDNGTLATAGADKTIRLWSVAAHKQIGRPLEGHRQAVNSIAFNRRGVLASASDDKTVRLWDLASHREWTLRGHTALVNVVRFSPDGKTLASASCAHLFHDELRDHTIRLWNVKRHRASGQLPAPSQVCGLAFGPKGHKLASANDDRTVTLWNLHDRRMIGAPLVGHGSPVNSVAFSPDGRTLASGSGDRTLRLWDVASHDQIGAPFSTNGSINSVTFTRDGRKVVSAGGDATVRLWSVGDPNALSAPVVGSRKWALSVAFNPRRPQVAWTTDDEDPANATVRLLDLTTRRQTAVKAPTGSINGLVYSPDGRRLFWPATLAHRIWTMDVETHAARELLKTPYKDVVKAIAISPDGKTLAYGDSRKGRAKIVLVDVGRTPPVRMAELKGARNEVHGLAFSPDGKTLASGGDDRYVWLWDVAARKRLAKMRGHSDKVFGVAFSPDGKTLASASPDQTVRLWDVRRRAARGGTMIRHSAAYSVAWAADGKRLASAGGDGQIQLWDAAAQRPLGDSFPGHAGPAFGVAFSPDGRTLASVSADGTVRLWGNFSLGVAKTRLCGYVDRRTARETWEALEPSIDFRPLPC